MASKIVLNGAEIDLDSREVTVGGELRKLPWRSFDVLVVLAKTPGEVVPKDRLLQEVWGAAAVDESNLTQAIAQIRKALGNLSEGRSYVDTIPRIGYRLSKEAVAPAPEPSPVIHSEVNSAPTIAAGPKMESKSLWIAIGSALALLAVAGSVTFLHSARQGDLHTTELSETPFTTLQGNEMSASFTPDGREVFFTWDKDGVNPDIFYRSMDSEIVHPFVVTDTAERGPVVSPDGRTVAFLRVRPALSEIVLKPRDGGSERVVATVDSPHPVLLASPGPFIAWTPDNEGLIYSHQRRLYLRRLNSSDAVALTNPPSTAARGDAEPALSHDGRTLVFVRDISAGVADLYELKLNALFEPAGPEQVLLSNGLWNRSPAWHPDGRHIVYNSGRWGQARLASLRVDQPSSARLLPSVGADSQQPAISPATGEILYTRYYFRTEIWKVNLSSPKGPDMQPLIVSTRFDTAPRISTDGSHIVFSSDRSGWYDIWTALIDGSNARRILAHSSSKDTAGSPDLSPDGTQVAFDRIVDGQRDIFICDLNGFNLRRLTDDQADDVVPRWSADGKSLYFASYREGNLALYKIDLSTKKIKRISPGGGNVASESADGKFLYYIESDNLSTDLFEMPLETGAPRRILSGVRQRAFAVTKKGIYFVPAEGPNQIRLFDPRTGQMRRVLTNPVRRIRSVSANVSGDILLATVEGESSGDLMRIEALPPD